MGVGEPAGRLGDLSGRGSSADGPSARGWAVDVHGAVRVFCLRERAAVSRSTVAAETAAERSGSCAASSRLCRREGLQCLERVIIVATSLQSPQAS